MEEEKRKHREFEAQLEKEKNQLLSQEKSLKEKPKVEEKVLDVLSPMREIKKDDIKIVYPFEQKLEALNSMGFVDREKNVKFLIKHKGELLPVIQDLLQSN